MKTFNCWFTDREGIERFQVTANDPYEATQKVREHLLTLPEDALPEGDYQLTISPNGDIEISWDEKAEKLRKVLEQSSCPLNFYRVLPCGCRE